MVKIQPVIFVKAELREGFVVFLSKAEIYGGSNPQFCILCHKHTDINSGVFIIIIQLVNKIAIYLYSHQKDLFFWGWVQM